MFIPSSLGTAHHSSAEVTFTFQTPEFLGKANVNMWGGKKERAKGAFSSTQVKYKASVCSGPILCLLKRGGRVTTR